MFAANDVKLPKNNALLGGSRMRRRIKRFILGMVITMIVCVAFSSFVGAVEFYPDNSELQFQLFERFLFVEDKLNQTGNDWTEEYALVLKTTVSYANEVYEKRNAGDIEINNAITAINLALDGKLKYSDINNYFDLEIEETHVTESPTLLPTTPTDIPIQEPTPAPTSPHLSEPTEKPTDTPTVIPTTVTEAPTVTPSVNSDTELVFYPDNSDLQIELYVAISTLYEMLSSTTGTTWTKEYLQSLREVRAKALGVYNNRSSSGEQISNAIQALRLAVDGNFTRDDIDRYFGGETDPTQVRYKCGDADGDGEITILDATTIQRRLASYSVVNPKITDTYGDVTGDGLDILDATCIQRHLVGLSTVAGIGEYV